MLCRRRLIIYIYIHIRVCVCVCVVVIRIRCFIHQIRGFPLRLAKIHFFLVYSFTVLKYLNDCTFTNHLSAFCIERGIDIDEDIDIVGISFEISIFYECIWIFARYFPPFRRKLSRGEKFIFTPLHQTELSWSMKGKNMSTELRGNYSNPIQDISMELHAIQFYSTTFHMHISYAIRK